MGNIRMWPCYQTPNNQGCLTWMRLPSCIGQEEVLLLILTGRYLWTKDAAKIRLLFRLRLGISSAEKRQSYAILRMHAYLTRLEKDLGDCETNEDNTKLVWWAGSAVLRCGNIFNNFLITLPIIYDPFMFTGLFNNNILLSFHCFTVLEISI